MNSWSTKYDACVLCGTIEKPHMAKGMCNTCYQRFWANKKRAEKPKKIKQPLITKQELHHLYINKQLSSPQIAQLRNCTPQAIRYYLKKYGIGSRDNSLSQETFLQKLRESWGDEYDFSKTTYNGAKEPLYVICKIEGHGGFWVTNADNFRRKLTRCPKCMSRQNLTLPRFQRLAEQAHGKKYSYERVESVNYSSKVEINCPEHGYFSQNVGSHLSGCGCPDCGNLKKGISFTNSIDKVIKGFRAVHGDCYDYKLVNYINNNTPVKIICPRHGVFTQLPSNHQQGKGCKVCGHKITTDKHRKNTQWFIEEAKKIFGFKYDYSKAEYRSKKQKIKIICRIHGEFQQAPDHHLRGQGCIECADYGFKKTEPAIAYYLRINIFNKTPIYKIGITNRTVNERWSKEDLDLISVIEVWHYEKGSDAYNFEQKILKLYESQRYKGSPLLSSGNTELFTNDILKLDC